MLKYLALPLALLASACLYDVVEPVDTPENVEALQQHINRFVIVRICDTGDYIAFDRVSGDLFTSTNPSFLPAVPVAEGVRAEDIC